MISAVMNREPVRVILLLDVSGSMQDFYSGYEGTSSLNLAEELVSMIPPESAIGLGFFHTEFIPVLRPTTDREKVRNQLEGLRSHPGSFRGKTALWDAVLGGVKMFDRPRLGDVIYVITDGDDNASKVTMNHVSQPLEEAGVRLFAFVFQKPKRPGQIESVKGFLQQVVRDTGGAIVVQMSEADGSVNLSASLTLFDKSGKLTRFGSDLESQSKQLGNFYRINIELPETLSKPQEWKLELAGLEEPQRKKIALTYPHVLVACN
ncbi:MAG TPA: vWA domain-containing protein [Candidatus Acidoferrum sp.]|nr:vWA domain-containing protein [Candidatus Acidoferrum sp.]